MLENFNKNKEENNIIENNDLLSKDILNLILNNEATSEEDKPHENLIEDKLQLLKKQEKIKSSIVDNIDKEKNILDINVTEWFKIQDGGQKFIDKSKEIIAQIGNVSLDDLEIFLHIVTQLKLKSATIRRPIKLVYKEVDIIKEKIALKLINLGNCKKALYFLRDDFLKKEISSSLKACFLKAVKIGDKDTANLIYELAKSNNVNFENELKPLAKEDVNKYSNNKEVIGDDRYNGQENYENTSVGPDKN